MSLVVVLVGIFDRLQACEELFAFWYVLGHRTGGEEKCK
jgi:hypothetical protein